MFEDAEPRPGKGGPLADLTREDLDLHSVEDLDDRIEILTAEIERARQARERKRSRREDADALFSFKT